MRLAWVWAGLLAACGAALPALPSQGGPAWHELTSMHFILWTDAPAARGRELVQEMEWLRSVIYGVAFPDLPPGGRTFVIALRDIHESRLYTPAYHDAFAAPPAHNPLRRPLIVMPADAYGDHFVVTHELTHAISFNAVHDQPRWYSEGLATFFEAIDLDMERGTVDVGALRDELRNALSVRGALLPSARVLDCERLACTDDFKFYVTAWALYAFLHYKHPRELAAFETGLATMPASAAWHAALPDVPPEALDHELVQWLMYGGYAIAHFKIEKRQWPITDRVLADADVHAARALLTWIFHPKSPDARRELAAAVAGDPTNVLGRALETWMNRHVLPLDVAKAVAAAHPDDMVAVELLAAASPRGAERNATIAKVCELAAADPALFAPPTCAKR